VAVSDPLFPPPPQGFVPPKPPPRPKPPREVNISFAVWVLTAVVGLVIQTMDTNNFVTQYMKSIEGTPGAEALDASTLKVVYLLAVIAVSVLMVFFAWKMRTGRNWARVLITVLTVIQLMTQASTVGFSFSLDDWLPLLSVLVAATGLVYMFVPPSNAYFREITKINLASRQR
jgi:CHASE2 domain-containing sensor protein